LPLLSWVKNKTIRTRRIKDRPIIGKEYLFFNKLLDFINLIILHKKQKANACFYRNRKNFSQEKSRDSD
jgi:hypothetical protein